MGCLKRAEPRHTCQALYLQHFFFLLLLPFFFFLTLAKIAQQDAAPAAPRCCSHGSPQPWPGCRMHTHNHHLQCTHYQGNKLQAIFKGSQAGKDTRPMSKKHPPGPPLPSVGSPSFLLSHLKAGPAQGSPATSSSQIAPKG